MNKELKTYINKKFDEKVTATRKERNELYDKLHSDMKTKVEAEKEDKVLMIDGLVKRIFSLLDDECIDRDYRFNYLKNIKNKKYFNVILTAEQKSEVDNNEQLKELDDKIDEINRTREKVVLRLSLEKKFDNINEILKEYGMEI